ncbi:uncharacterized protein DUF4369 [Mesonia algae]|jgi:hypothetical protein|uniref:Uncharacterized protein DUF4369 n=1 Tax=Mesonia algae TaxID=213248 RepID=A0A2W7HU71_9FLAO|nr:DUF4369 domain-containing protein [Mesonia algae]PZW37757.1 uncharacterized protein DUF4369 [Mesonia algae]
MKRIFILTLTILVMVSCQEKETNFSLSGNIKGLKQGSLYLQKIKDTSIVNIDSVIIDGDSNYLLEAYIDEPEIMFLYLDKIDGDKNDDIIDFFAEKGEMTINSTLDNFVANSKVSGSKNQAILEEYEGIIKRFNEQNLDLVKESFDAQKANDQEKVLAINKSYENLLKRKYLYTVNFAINHKDKEVSPYIILTEAFDANIKYLDTVYNSYQKEIRKSKYGKELKDLIKEQRKLLKLEDKVSDK